MATYSNNSDLLGWQTIGTMPDRHTRIEGGVRVLKNHLYSTVEALHLLR